LTVSESAAGRPPLPESSGSFRLLDVRIPGVVRGLAVDRQALSTLRCGLHEPVFCLDRVAKIREAGR